MSFLFNLKFSSEHLRIYTVTGIDSKMKLKNKQTNKQTLAA